MNDMVAKPVSEDWSHFNRSVEDRAKTLSGKRFGFEDEEKLPLPPLYPAPSVIPPAPPAIVGTKAIWGIAGGLALIAVAIVVGAYLLHPIIGPMGPQGATGPQGVMGPQGAQGITGSGSGMVDIRRPRFPNSPPPAPSIEDIPIPGQPAQPAKVMEEVTRFFTVKLDGERTVHTGWRYSKSDEDMPSVQYCYVDIPTAGHSHLTVNIANTKKGIHPYDSETMQSLSAYQYREALANCQWVPGMEPR